MKNLYIKLLALTLAMSSFVGCDDTTTDAIDVVPIIAEETAIDEIIVDDIDIEDNVVDDIDVVATIAEDTDVDETDVEDTVIDDTDVVATIAEDTIVDETDVEDTVIDDTDVVATIAEDTDVAATIAEDTVVEDTIVEDTVVEDTIVDDTDVEDTVVEDTVIEDTVVEDTVVEDTVVEETVVEDTVVEETVVEDTVVEDTIAEETIVEDTVVEDTIVEDTATPTTSTTNPTPTTVPDASVKSSIYSQLVAQANSPTQMTVYGSAVPTSSYMYKNLLSATEQDLYSQLYNGFIQAQTTVTYNSSLDYETVFKVADYVLLDHPELIWINLMTCSTLNNTITVSYNGLQNNVSSYYDKMATILANAKDLPTDYDKIKYIHNFISYHTTFDVSYVSANDSQTAYSCLVGGRTVCAGYAKATQHCLQLLGIPTSIVSGTTINGSHMWNLVYTGGQYFNLDINWDDWSSDPTQYNYTYYMLSDSQLSTTRGSHYRDSISSLLPRA